MSVPRRSGRYTQAVHTVRLLFGFSLVLLIAAFPQPLSGQDRELDIIRIVSPYRTQTLDPIKSVFTGSIEAFGQLYTRLLMLDENDELVPGLALRWEVSEDASEYTFYLREAKFSNGDPITADDVAFTLLRMRDDPEAAYSEIVTDMKNAWAVDEHTLRVEFHSPNVPFLQGIEMSFLGIVSRADVEGRGAVEAFADVPVSSGPYRVVEWRRNDRLILEPNPHYWRQGYPLNDGAELIEVVDVNTRIAMYTKFFGYLLRFWCLHGTNLRLLVRDKNYSSIRKCNPKDHFGN